MMAGVFGVKLSILRLPLATGILAASAAGIAVDAIFSSLSVAEQIRAQVGGSPDLDRHVFCGVLLDHCSRIDCQTFGNAGRPCAGVAA